MQTDCYSQLHDDGLLSDESYNKVNEPRKSPDVSVNLEVSMVLYMGVLLLTAGLGLLIYKNIDTIGHKAVLILIGLISATSLFYCFKTTAPFRRAKVTAPNVWFDYILLLGCISLVSFLGYWQYQYQIFGTHYGLATFIPMLILFFAAYYFDHLGVLSTAIANLAVWMGVSVTPRELLMRNDFNSAVIINTYLLLGTILIGLGFCSGQFKFKKHFKFSYQHYGIHAFYIALLAGYFHYYDTVWAAVYMIALFGFSYLLYNEGMKERSFYFLLLMTLYTYFAASSLIMRAIILMQETAIYFALLYFICSATSLIFVLINFNRRLKAA